MPIRLAASPDGQFLAANDNLAQSRDWLKKSQSPFGKGFVLLNLKTGEDAGITLQDTESSTTTIHSFSHDGRLVVGFTTDGTEGFQRLCIWELPSGKLLRSWEGRAVAAFSPTTPVLAIAESFPDPDAPRQQRDGMTVRPPDKSVVGFWDVSGLGKSATP